MQYQAPGTGCIDSAYVTGFRDLASVSALKFKSSTSCPAFLLRPFHNNYVLTAHPIILVASFIVFLVVSLVTYRFPYRQITVKLTSHTIPSNIYSVYHEHYPLQLHTVRSVGPILRNSAVSAGLVPAFEDI